VRFTFARFRVARHLEQAWLPLPTEHHHLELRDNGIVQCRGFANSKPSVEALTIAKTWADESGLSWAAD
jgi:hypothetical protein